MRSTNVDEITIRLAVAADAESLAALAHRTFYETYVPNTDPRDMAIHLARLYSPAMQLAEINDPAMRTLLAVQEDRLIGFAQLRLNDPRHAEPACVTGPNPMEIWRFYVDQPWHGRGIAQRLMHEAIELAKSHGAKTIWLGVWERNPRAIAFYRKCGYQIIGEHQFLFADQMQTDWVMAQDVQAYDGFGTV
jgi:ribosomal protein S18 acetylase RimI-like enzyme